MKILYVCPFAHYSGHHPHVAVVEPEILKKAGHDVDLLTFGGIINGAEARVPHYTALAPDSRLQGLLVSLRYRTLTRWVLMGLETLITLMKAVKLKRQKGYDILHLRDAEPLPFLCHIVSLPFRGIKWAASMTASVVYKPLFDQTDLLKRPFIWMYCIALYGINSKFWKPIYQLSMRRNRFIFMPQNDDSSKAYRNYMDGIFADKVVCVPWGISRDCELVSKQEARQKLELPQDAFVLLSFGAPHSGKDMRTVFEATQKIDGIFLVHAGTHAFSLGSNPVALADTYNLNGRVKIFNYFIPEQLKPYLFGSADAIVLSYTKAFACTSSMLWEAAKYQKPVISSDANLLGADVLRYNLGVLFEAENALSLAKAITAFRGLSVEALDQIRYGGQRFLDMYSDKAWVDNCNKVYGRLME